MTPRPAELTTALAFLDAISRRDEAALFALADPQIAIAGPRGTASGHEVLQRWFDGVRLVALPQTGLVRHNRVLVLHRMSWLDEAGAATATLDNASLLQVTGGLVNFYTRDDAPDPVQRLGFGGAPEFQLQGQTR